MTARDPGTDLLDFPLFEAMMGRRARRLSLGMEIPSGPLAFTSRAEPEPLSEHARYTNRPVGEASEQVLASMALAIGNGNMLMDDEEGVATSCCPSSHRSDTNHEHENPALRGCISSFGRYRTRLVPILRRINDYLVRWAMRRYKRLRGRKRRAWQFLKAVARRQPALFAHWRLGPTP